MNTLPQWPDEYPRLQGVEFETPTQSKIVVPVIRFNYPVACVSITSSKKIDIDEELEIFSAP
jgi:putative methionine-R-sulfoxide reductase with GAF domain